MERASSAALEVVEPGLLLTVQDRGRPGFEHLGVPRAGAADGRSLDAANRVVGNDPDAAALEATLLGPRLRAVRSVTIAIAGADLGPRLQPGARSITRGRPIELMAGDEIELGEAGDPDRGCRAYLAIAGGIDVPVVLGSRSTSLVGGFGGFEGRPLRTGDGVAAFHTAIPAALAVDEDRSADDDRSAPWRRPVVVLRGPAASEPGGEARFRTLIETAWTVSNNSDRRGLRLEADLDLAGLALSGDRPSGGVVPGAIQLTPSGEPLVLMPDGGVTGGYAVIALVATLDLPTLGQLTPGATLRFDAGNPGG